MGRQIKVGEVYSKRKPHVGYMVIIKTGFYCYYIVIDDEGQVLGTGHLTASDFQRREVQGYVTNTLWSTSNNQLEIIWRAK